HPFLGDGHNIVAVADVYSNVAVNDIIRRYTNWSRILFHSYIKKEREEEVLREGPIETSGLVYEKPTVSYEDLVARILVAADHLRHQHGVIQNFSCAAQQLNASQSTHRFSFVNHTIKTVNMPKVRHSVNLKSKLTSYISEFKEDGLSTDNKILFCNLCQCAVSSTQKFLVQQHITTSKHQANKQLNSKQRQLFLTQPTTSNVRSEFNIDLCRSLISADIPLYKLKNKVFREFLEKYTQHTIPDESTLRKTYAPSIYDETIQKIRDEIKDSSIWVSIDETPDKEGRLVGNVVIGLLSEQYSERILLHCDVLEKCNNKTIVKLFNEAMGILWPKGIIEKVFLKAPSRVNVLKENPEIPLPPKPILTRWGTWLEAVEYYAEHIDSINNVLLALDSEDAVSIDTAKTVTCDISVKNDLAHIQHTFSCIIKTLKSLQNRHLSLSESFEIINSTVEQLNRGRGKVADAVRAKVDTVLSKTLDMKNYKKVVAVMSGESTVKINLDLSPADIVKMNYVPVTSCDVERSFSQYKSILRDNRRRFTFQHLKEMFVTYCYGTKSDLIIPYSYSVIAKIPRYRLSSRSDDMRFLTPFCLFDSNSEYNFAVGGFISYHRFNINEEITGRNSIALRLSEATRIPNLTGPVDNNDVTLQRNRNKTAGSRTHHHDTTVHDVIRLLIPALYKNQSDSLMAADGDCHHLCKLMAPVRHRWSISDSIGEIRNTVMPSDCSALRFGIRS
ncbi:hypothetical protein ANN_13669, partial [Periplaneta americana]